jgi:uncharacterized repeat protein (TIGR01451 family)
MKKTWAGWVIAVGLGVLPISALGAIDGKYLTIGDADREGGAPYFYAKLDAAGFSDGIWYGRSPIHPYEYHELLSGEWAAAIYYDGIDTAVIDPETGRRQAMWLTRQFEYPDWFTNSTFTASGICTAWNNPVNPIPYNDTGQSVITNGEVEVTIYYEVVHPLWSVMSFLTDSNEIGYMYSDTYLFLQTYVIRNLKSEPLTNLEFYQFLHSHGADDYGPYINSTYCDIAFPDPLANYVPFNPVHQVGNFRYDITQWNGPNTSSSHVDYVGFSSTVEPDWIDNDVYAGGHTPHPYKPPIGTHLHIENRSLNGRDRIFGAEVGGAMGWALGSLDPNETVSLTLAYMFGPLQETEEIVLGKTDDVPAGECVQPGDSLTYTISWRNVSIQQDAENAVLVDYLPAGVEYDYVLSVNPLVVDANYNPAEHSYTWALGTIAAGSSGSRQLTVRVNEKAEPGMRMRNRAVLTCSLGQVSTEWNTPVCCWDTGGIIYVDSRAAGADIGTSWTDAYRDLQRALARAAAGCGGEIWVAQGSYDPGRLPEEVFIIPSGVSVYGGFAGTETSRSQRNPKRYPTILTGAADEERNDTVVRMMNNTLLDGFTVTGAAEYGIYSSGADFALENCTIEKNNSYGIYSINGNIAIKWCEIRDNRDEGILHLGTGYTLDIENCRMLRNSGHGVFCQNSTPIVRNSIVCENDLSEGGNAGIRILNPGYLPVLHNNTIAHNKDVGISFTDDGTANDPNDKDWPDVQNCILWHNNGGGEQFSGFSRSHIRYSCIYDPNDPQGESTVKDAHFNFTTNPKFAYNDPNNLHIAYDSPCKDAGSPYLSYAGQLDMDRKDRVYGLTADAGAYEITCEDISNELDLNADGLVNFVEFASLARAWLSRDPNDPALPTDPNLIDPNDFIGWNPVWDLDGDYAVGLQDLVLFAQETPWLWTACWLDIESLTLPQMASVGEEILMRSGNFVGLEDLQVSYETMKQPALSVDQQISQLQEAIAFLEQLWREDPAIQQVIDAEAWQEFMKTLHQGLFELRTGGVCTE